MDSYKEQHTLKYRYAHIEIGKFNTFPLLFLNGKPNPNDTQFNPVHFQSTNGTQADEDAERQSHS